MRVRVWCLLFALLAFTGGFACDPTPTPTAVPSPTRTPAPTRTPLPTPTPELPVTLRWNLHLEPESIDPAQYMVDVDVARQLFLGLTAYDPRTNEPVPDLATHWEIGDGGQVYTFHLRADVQWVQYDLQTDQVKPIRPVTAHDVVYSLRRAVRPEMTDTYGPPAYVLDVIQNAELINTTPLTGTYDLESLGVTALDDYIVRLTLERPAAHLPAILASPIAWPVPREAVEAHGDQWTEPGHIITNGPYALAEWAHEESLTLVKNPLYHDADAVQIERVECVMAGAEAVLDYEFGRLDTVWLSSSEIYSDVVRAHERELHAQALSYTFYYAFDTTRPPFDNVHARRALSFAIDRRAIANRLGQENPPADIFSPPTFPGYAGTAALIGPLYDPQRAREELARAGYPDGKGSPDVLCLMNTPFIYARDTDHLIADMLQAMWRENLGIDVEMMEVGDGFWLRAPPLPHVWRRQWYADYLDLANILEDPHRETLYSYTKALEVRPDAANPAHQRLTQVLADAARELDPSRREALHRELEQLLCVDVCLVAPILHWRVTWLTKPYLHRDYPDSNIVGQNFKDWRIDPH